MAVVAATPEIRDESFRPLPVGKLLMDLLESARDELIYKWGSDPEDDDGYPILSYLWIHAEVSSGATLAGCANDPVASAFRRAAAAIDALHGDPLSRGWRLTWPEAHARHKTVIRYLYDSGLLGLREAEADAPRHYLSDGELEGD
ncbi:MAG: hypothetical protein ACYDDZ_06635 [Acidimicrobiales bacterium]